MKHHITLQTVTDAPSVRALCSCGWTSMWSAEADKAKGYGTRHAQGVAHGFRPARTRKGAPVWPNDEVPRGREETSQQAFDSIRHRVRAGDCGIVFQHFRSAGDRGWTCDEMEQATGLKHQTCSARFNDLKRWRVIEASDRRRPTRSGRDADVYVLRPGWEE